MIRVGIFRSRDFITCRRIPIPEFHHFLSVYSHRRKGKEDTSQKNFSSGTLRMSSIQTL
jgi:hypothetical protein